MAYLLLDSIFLERLDKLLGEVYPSVRLVEPTRHNVSILTPPMENGAKTYLIKSSVTCSRSLPSPQCTVTPRNDM